MLTARPEGGNGVGKYACLCLGSRCPPSFTPLAKRSWKCEYFEVFLQRRVLYEKHPRRFGRSDQVVRSSAVENVLRTYLTPGPAAVTRHLGAKKNMFGSHDPQAGTLR